MDLLLSSYVSLYIKPKRNYQISRVIITLAYYIHHMTSDMS